MAVMDIAEDQSALPVPDEVTAEPEAIDTAKKRKEITFRISQAAFIGTLSLFIILHFLGIYLFTTGFLLTRFVLDHQSHCSIPPIAAATISHQSGTVSKGCWHPKSFDKAVVILIDALRYDFTVPFQSTPSDVNPHYFHNAFPILYEIASKEPQKAFLLPFIADPPTTTLQRLKALTTGTLPTFVEAGSNFAGTAIEEDSIVRQLYSANKTIVHIGDDTWHSLFPGLFDPELTKPFESFNAWDLHTVDDGVIEHLFPLLHPSNYSRFDVVFGHFLGVDHAGHAHGPDHPAMSAKLQQMNNVCKQIIELLDESTLMVVMGDHGMDSSGNHGGESSDEKEAALWMYSKGGFFGRKSPNHVLPPATAKERPVNQIDLVPTLSLLLGLPIPFGNLGAPIAEAFIGANNKGLENLAIVNRLTGAQIDRYLQEYARAQDLEANSMNLPTILWDSATREWDTRRAAGQIKEFQWESLGGAFLSYQMHTLEVFRRLWTRFDLVSMCLGIFMQAGAFVTLAFYARSFNSHDVSAQWSLLAKGYIGLGIGLLLGFCVWFAFPPLGLLRIVSFSAGFCCLAGIASALRSRTQSAGSLIPGTFWGRICTIIPLILSAGFGANSFTIWEDEILLFFLALIGTIMLASSFRIKSSRDRKRAIFHSMVFMTLTRIGSLSRVCREEQTSRCLPTFHPSSAAIQWQLIIPYFLAIALPNIIRAYYKQTNSYHGAAVTWIGFAFRVGLLLNAIYWTIEAADDGQWLNLKPGLLKSVRTYLAQVILAVNLAAGVATFGWSAPLIGVEHIQLPAPPLNPSKPQRSSKSANGSAHSKAKSASVTAQSPNDENPSTQVLVRGTNNLYGSHYTLLPLTILVLPLLVLSKPMAQAAVALLTVVILSLLELLHLLHLLPSNATTISKDKPWFSPAGPTILALLAHHTFFKTGHQATLASIQWNSAFIALNTLSYPLAPLYVILNTFSAQALCAFAVPCLVLWRRKLPPRVRRVVKEKADSLQGVSGGGGDGNASDDSSAMHNGFIRPTTTAVAQESDASTLLLGQLASGIATFILVFALVSVATTLEVAWLRRHLMLYRVFMPRWALGGAALLLVDIMAVFGGLVAVGWSVCAVGNVFGWG